MYCCFTFNPFFKGHSDPSIMSHNKSFINAIFSKKISELGKLWLEMPQYPKSGVIRLFESGSKHLISRQSFYVAFGHEF